MMSTAPSFSLNATAKGSNGAPIIATGNPAMSGSWNRKDRPCDSCRRRKSRCIIPENMEICIMCHSRGEECTFVQTPQRRKRRRVDGEDGTKARSPDAEKSLPGKPPIDDYTALPGSLLKQTLGLQNRQHGQYLGQTTEYDTRLINLSPFNGRGEYVSTPGTLRRVNNQTHFIMKSESQEEVDDELANLDIVESVIRPHGKALVKLYFRIIHPSFPIMDKKVFLEKYERTYREFTPPLLAAVYILALNWWSYTPELVNLPKPDAAKLEKLVPKFMSDVLNRPKLSTVQAGLLLLQRPDGDSWALTGQLVAAAQNLGMHLNCSRWKIPEWERSLRKKLAWALFMQDKWGALIHGRPPLIHHDDWAVMPLEERDFSDNVEDEEEEEGSSEIENGRLIFLHMISLTEILSDILKTFFTLRATGFLEAEEEKAFLVTLERAKPIQLRLKEWHAKLPSCLAVGHMKARKLSSTGSLNLAYFAAEVTLHRAIIRFDSFSIDDQLRAITRSAARMRFTNAIDLVNKLEPSHLQSFWYFASKTNLAIIGTFGSLLWATSDSIEESEFYRSQLAEYRWTLRVSSKGAEFMKFTVGMLDASAVFVKDNASKMGTPTMVREPVVGEVSSNKGTPQTWTPKFEFDNSTQPQSLQGANEVSPSIGTSTDNAYPYDTDFSHVGMTLAPDVRPPWGNEFDDFEIGEAQDWSMDQMYEFSPLQDMLGNRRMPKEYDESGDVFAGF
ncbi:fungal-specific transcription factor domain-containing protein [Calycina marina]|uniref:Fungal-specific transcription factor domain-containing protein n=1 Tax=Calycina marina TaxID=1763456 RepID=A0A9P7Z4K7_9HELO|nr:fungal-specific transcription factor domain-containing protein [Calycina marina]